MAQHGIGAIILDAGPSLDYFTGVQWWRSERLTGAVIPASGDPIIVTSFFESPSVAESLNVPAEIRTWNEDEDPLKLVAAFLRERGVAGEPVGFEETDRFFILDRLQQQLPGARPVSANPVVRGCRMIKSPAELALMQAANDIMAASLRYAGERTRAGMTPADIDALIAGVHKHYGSTYDPGLILIGEASAYPHGSHKPHVVGRGDIVLMDCTSTVHGYQADMTRTFVFGADPTPEQRKVWDQVHRGQQIAITTARVGATGRESRRRRACRLRKLGLWARLPASRTIPPHRSRHRDGGPRAGLPRPWRDDSAGARHVLLGRAGDLYSGQVRGADRRLLAHDRERAPASSPSRRRASTARSASAARRGPIAGLARPSLLPPHNVPRG